MKKSYYLFLLLLVAATSFSVHAQTGQKFPDFKLALIPQHYNLTLFISS